MEVAEHQLDFAKTSSISFLHNSNLKIHAADMENLTRTPEQRIMDDDDDGHVRVQIHDQIE